MLLDFVFASVMSNHIHVSIFKKKEKKKYCRPKQQKKAFLYWTEINHLSEGKERRGSGAAVTWLKLAGGKMNVETGMAAAMVNGRIDHGQTAESILCAQNKRRYLTE